MRPSRKPNKFKPIEDVSANHIIESERLLIAKARQEGRTAMIPLNKRVKAEIINPPPEVF